MKIRYQGSTGMLGNAVGGYFLRHYDEDQIQLSDRNEKVAYGKHRSPSTRSPTRSTPFPPVMF